MQVREKQEKEKRLKEEENIKWIWWKQVFYSDLRSVHCVSGTNNFLLQLFAILQLFATLQLSFLSFLSSLSLLFVQDPLFQRFRSREPTALTTFRSRISRHSEQLRRRREYFLSLFNRTQKIFPLLKKERSGQCRRGKRREQEGNRRVSEKGQVTPWSVSGKGDSRVWVLSTVPFPRDWPRGDLTLLTDPSVTSLFSSFPSSALAAPFLFEERKNLLCSIEKG